MNAPSVSIVLPTYNRARFLARALDTIRAQSRADYEVLVIDDNSTDETSGLLAQRAAEDRRIRPIRNRGPHGPAGARNTGIAEARAGWLAFLDDDDEWLPEKLTLFCAAQAPDVALIGSDYRMVEDDAGAGRTMREFLSQVMIPWWRGHPLARAVFDPDELARSAAALENPRIIRAMALGGFLWPHTSSVMVRTDAARAAGGFDTGMHRTEDMRLWLKLLPMGRVVFIDQPLARYHIQGRDAGTSRRYAGQSAERRLSRYKEMRDHLNLLKELPRWGRFGEAERRFQKERIQAYHWYCAQAAAGLYPWRARWHRLWAGGKTFA